ncbi:SAM-dependent methyltransferase [Streptosporangium sp. NPDC000239]|uniref:SAM-dependent methyltransferase n=1 Tax=unclassified Streptosporangium TaxID=2632669 RepID=UPI0033236D23
MKRDDSPSSPQNPSEWKLSQQKPEIDTTVPHSARIWNYWLGGKDNYPVDREAGEQFAEVFPGIAGLARASRHFLARAIRHLAGEEGIRQFLDIGTGLPTVDNTHEVAQRVAPDSRIVYVDNDPLVLVHAGALLTSTPQGMTTYINADLYDPDTILAAAAKTLDLTRPVALVLMQITGHVRDTGEAHAIVRRLMDALPSGSFLAFNDSVDTNAENFAATQQYNDSGAAPYHLRSPEELAGFFDGLDLLEPGVVPITHWRPEVPLLDPVADVDALGGVARKR